MRSTTRLRLALYRIHNPQPMNHSASKRGTDNLLWTAPKQNYRNEFIEEEGKIFVVFYYSEDNLVAKKEIPHWDVTEAMRLSGDKN